MAAASPALRPGKRVKIAVVGNCQSAGIADCLNVLSSAVIAMPFMVHTFAQALRPRIFDNVRKYDIIISQPIHSFGELNTQSLRTLNKPLLTFPNIYFRGFHPDICFIGPGGSRIRTPLANNNSYIIFESFLRGLTEAECFARFTPETYRELGYDAAWDNSLATLMERERSLDVKISQFFQDRSIAPNLYVVNHPRTHLLYDAAVQILNRLEFPWQAVNIETIPDRLLEGSIWPLYGGPVNTAPQRIRFKSNAAKYFTLAEFISASYATYARVSRRRMVVNSPDELVRQWTERVLEKV